MHSTEAVPSRSAPDQRQRRGLSRRRLNRTGARDLEVIDEDPIPDQKTGLLEDLSKIFDRGQMIRARLQEMDSMSAEGV